MRLALTAGAAFVCGEMGHRRDLCSSHTLCRDQRAAWMHLMIAARARAPTSVHRYTHTHTYNETWSRVNMLRG